MGWILVPRNLHHLLPNDEILMIFSWAIKSLHTMKGGQALMHGIRLYAVKPFEIRLRETDIHEVRRYGGAMKNATVSNRCDHMLIGKLRCQLFIDVFVSRGPARRTSLYLPNTLH